MLTLNDILQEALQAYNTGQFEKSRQLLESGLALDEHSQPCLWGLIKVCDALQDEQGSVNSLHKLATLLPDDISVLEAFTARCQTPKQLDLAIDLYAGYLHRRPDSADGHYNYAYLLARIGKPSSAIPAYERAIALGAERPEEIVLNISTVYSQQLRDDAEADLQLHRAIALNSRYVPAFFNLGCLAEQQGDRDGACAHFSHCLELDSSYLPALARLADARQFEDETDPLIVRLKAQAARSDDPDLHFALGRALEQCGKFRASLAHFDKANSADRLTYREYVPTVIEAEFDAIKKTFNDEWFKQNRLSHSASPVFICGMFRSGSTLVEQILAAHSAFTPAGEREFFSRLVETELPDYPRDSEQITKSELQSWVARYQEESDRIFGRNTRLTDKRPDNFLYLGLIKALFPAAKIIVTHRAWHDIAWSIYSTRFGQAQHYATDIRTIRHYINLQTDLMTYWRSLFGQDIFTVEYESLVIAPRQTLTSLLNFLGEPWEEGCLRFNTLKNTVKTESVWQVRQPLYTSSVGRSAPFAELRPELFD